MTASMRRRTEPVVPLVPRFQGRVQSKRAAAPTLWTRRFARRSVDAAIGPSRSAPPAIAATRIARRRVVRPPAVHPSARLDNAIAAARKADSIIAITSARTAPA